MNKKTCITVALFNDTGSFSHVGCKAVSDAHDALLRGLDISVLYRHYVDEFHDYWDGSRVTSRARLFRSPIVTELSRIDAVIVNGEGTIHHGNGLHLLVILAAAQELGKPTYLVNCVLQDVHLFDDVLRNLSDLTVRDVFSYNYLRSKGIQCRLVADSILAASFHSGLDDEFVGKIVVTDCVAGQEESARQLQWVLNHFGEDAVFYPLEGSNSWNWRDALRKIRSSRLVVTGRHHGLYLSLMAKRPFVVLPSNTWKLEGTLAALGAEKWLASASDNNVVSLCESALKEEEAFRPIFNHSFLQSPIMTFAKLAEDFGITFVERVHADGNMVINECLEQYKQICDYVKPGDRVLIIESKFKPAAAIIQRLTLAGDVVVVDDNSCLPNVSTGLADDAADYKGDAIVSATSSFGSASFDAIIAIGASNQAIHPLILLKEFLRLLTPGGRLFIDYSSDCCSETDRRTDYVNEYEEYKRELVANFIFETAFIPPVDAHGSFPLRKTTKRPSLITRWDEVISDLSQDCIRHIVVAMKSPISANVLYEERVFHNLRNTGHPSVSYQLSFQNPWLMHAMVNSGYRLKNEEALEKLADEVMAISPRSSCDYSAALCVKAYRVLSQKIVDEQAVREAISQIDAVCVDLPKERMGLRWRISLLFVKAKLLLISGHREQAKETFVECANNDVRSFGIHLATKTTEAWFEAGKIAFSLQNLDEARSFWSRGLNYGKILLGVSLDDILINASFPNRFNHGDGVREYSVAWDNIARCANGLHLLNRGRQFDYLSLDNCLQSEYIGVTSDLLECRRQLIERTDELIAIRKTLAERTNTLEQISDDLIARTDELVATRKTLVERSTMLERANKDLSDRTEELVATRAALSGRTAVLEQTSKDLTERTEDLVATRQALYDRTVTLEQASQDLTERTEELITTRQALSERTVMLEQASKDLIERTEELVTTRQALSERTEMLEQAGKDLSERTEELVATRQALSDRKRELNDVQQTAAVQAKQLQAASEELTRIKKSVAYRLFYWGKK